jgi:hypothetical protein
MASKAEGMPGLPRSAAPPVNEGMVRELMRMFKGYVVRHQKGAYTFGLKDGALIRDAHTFQTQGDSAAAYRAFLDAKIREGFIPQADRVEALRNDPVSDLDAHAVARAYSEANSR